MPYIQLEDYYSVGDILDWFGSSEYDELLDHIVESGDLIRPVTDSNSADGGEFEEALNKLREHRLELSLEYEKTILEIAKKV